MSDEKKMCGRCGDAFYSVWEDPRGEEVYLCGACYLEVKG